MEIAPSSGEFCFQGGHPQTWVEVDWFQDTEDMMLTVFGREKLIDFITAKDYYKPDQAYLLLSPQQSITLNYGKNTRGVAGQSPDGEI